MGGLLSPGTGSITSFTFTAQLPGTVVQAQVYQWQLGGSNQNAGQPIGSSLYTSAPLTGTDGYSGLSQYTFTSTIHMTAGTQYVLYLQYISGPDGLVGNSLSYDSQAPSTAGRVTYYPQNSPPMWQGSLSGSIALTYTFCGELASAKLSNGYWGCVLQPPLMQKARRRSFASAAGVRTVITA